MATYDQNGNAVDTVENGQLDDAIVTAPRREDWSGLLYAFMAGLVVLMLDTPRRKRRRRR